MNATRSVSALSCALVHVGARASELDRGRHERFIREKLVLISLVLAALPLGLAFQGVPSPTEAALFALTLMPLAAALLVARSGCLAAAQAVAAAGEIAIALLLAAVAGAAAAFGWLILASIEMALASDRTLLRRAAVILIPAAGAIVALDGVAAGGHAADASARAAFCAFAVAMLAGWRLVEAGRDDRRGSAAAARATALTEALGDPVAVFDAGGALIEGVAGCEALLGTGPGELAGRAFFDLVNVADRPAFLKLLGDAVHQGGPQSGTVRLRTASLDQNPAGYGEPRHVTAEVRARAAGREVVAVLRDVTEARRREAEIDEAQRSIDAALRAKDHFLANMSHELRTPLNAIIGFSEMLGSRTMSPSDPAKQREYAGIIHQSGQHLLSVVNSILDMSKIQSGTFALLPEPFAVLPLAEQCCEVVRLQAQNGRIEIVRDVPGDLEEIVADRRACQQILINLLSNAVKFTPECGRVTLRVRPEGTALRISVGDTGIGIGEADLARLGDAFFQAGSSLSRPFEGTGLGLSVVRGLVGLHGGTISIESELGKGTGVTVRLPLDCRVALGAPSATIETIPRRSSTDPASLFDTRRASDTRMKQSA